MSRRKITPKSKTVVALEQLRPEETAAVLSQLLDKHPELRAEAEELATRVIATVSIEAVAQEVYVELTSIGLDALNERAGSHSWGYVEPSEAAAELLAEAIEDRVQEMKRSVELGLLAPAEALCAGLVLGLFQADNAKSDGALGWAADFPAEEAGFIVGEFLSGCRPALRKTAQAHLMQVLSERTPQWLEDLQRPAEQILGDEAEIRT